MRLKMRKAESLAKSKNSTSAKKLSAASTHSDPAPHLTHLLPFDRQYQANYRRAYTVHDRKMFSVSGWAVTAPLKTQVATGGSGVSTKPQTTEQSQDAADKKNLKRKRGKGKEVTNVTGENVEGLWESVIEGKKPKRVRTKKRKDKGDGEKPAAAKGAEEAPKETTVLDAGAQSKDKKKSKKVQQPKKSDPPVAQSSEPKLTPLQASMRAKLSSARFRHLNEQLYTTPSSTALSLFNETPDLFNEYHTGFRQQVAVWPENPLDAYITELRTRGALRRASNPNKAPSGGSAWSNTPLPRSKGTCTVADIGCGDARLSSTLQKQLQKLNLKIHSFDLHSPSPLVTTADAASLPIADGSADISIFCLALMGTNWLDFIDEAWRVLRPSGELWIAEIKSRFSRGGPANMAKNNTNNARVGSGWTKGGIGTKRSDVPALSKRDREKQEAEDEAELAAKVDVLDATGKPAIIEKTDISAFVTALRRRGFALAGSEKDAVDMGNKMFVKMRFIKAAQPTRGKNATLDDGPAPLDEERGGKQFGDRVPKKKMKFLEDLNEGNDEDESKILKPCVYKLR
jgi:ribosomal RNA-processing protein 8